MVDRQSYVYVGVDLHKEKHVAVVIDCWTTKITTIEFENKPAAFPEMLRKVKKAKCIFRRIRTAIPELSGQ